MRRRRRPGGQRTFEGLPPAAQERRPFPRSYPRRRLAPAARSIGERRSYPDERRSPAVSLVAGAAGRSRRRATTNSGGIVSTSTQSYRATEPGNGVLRGALEAFVA